MPRQYVVNPPIIDLTGSPGDSSQEDESAARLAADSLQATLNGGLEVRLCNPCVPDPNPLPPPSYHSTPIGVFPSQQLHQNAAVGPLLGRRRSNNSSGRPIDYAQYIPSSSTNSLVGRRTSSILPPNPTFGVPTTPFGSAPDAATLYNPRHGYPRSHRQHASLSMLPSSRHRAVFDAMTSAEAPPEEPPRRQIAEEDECPICHEELPPKGPEGSETDREAHVASCIEGHFSSSRPKDSSMPHPGTAVAAAVMASAATPAQAGSSLPNNSIAGPSTRRRTTGMVVYSATEKDCMGEDGAVQECIICFEDFEPGIEMGRLECLCKFHKTCIRGWWDTKGVGACPVHQGGLI